MYVVARKVSSSAAWSTAYSTPSDIDFGNSSDESLEADVELKTCVPIEDFVFEPTDPETWDGPAPELTTSDLMSGLYRLDDSV